MFDLSNFYDYCTEKDVDLFVQQDMPFWAVILRDQGYYAIAMNPNKIPDMRCFRAVCMHEQGHVATGALHKVSSPYQLWEQSEYRANRWDYEEYLSPQDFRTAFRKGYTAPWQLAEYFDLPQRDIEKALHYWTQCREVNFNDAI